MLKEYGIYIRQGSGTPYMIHIFDNLDNAKIKLYDMISLDEERLNPYFVDNDFFENRYDISIKLKYYCIKEREVSEWQTYSKEKIEEEQKDKIVYLLNYKK